jgi:hypothetical protein
MKEICQNEIKSLLAATDIKPINITTDPRIDMYFENKDQKCPPISGFKIRRGFQCTTCWKCWTGIQGFYMHNDEEHKGEASYQAVSVQKLFDSREFYRVDYG